MTNEEIMAAMTAAVPQWSWMTPEMRAAFVEHGPRLWWVMLAQQAYAALVPLMEACGVSVARIFTPRALGVLRQGAAFLAALADYAEARGKLTVVH